MLEALFSSNALLFTMPALLGSAVFLLKLGLMTLGGVGGDVDVDIDADVDVDLGADVEAGDSTAAFNLLSIQSIAAFLMGFGWGGLGGLVGLDLSLGASLLTGAGAGVAMVWLLGLVLKAVYDLQSSGNIHLADAVGADGTVYASVPARGEGRGQVRVIVDDHARIYTAVSEAGPLPTASAVRVVRANPDHTLTVAPL